MPANQCLSFLRSVYRRPCGDYEGLRNPVEQCFAAGGLYHRKTQWRISSPAEVLPRWRAGMEAAVRNPVHRDLLLFGLYTGDAPGRDHAASVGAGNAFLGGHLSFAQKGTLSLCANSRRFILDSKMGSC